MSANREVVRQGTIIKEKFAPNRVDSWALASRLQILDRLGQSALRTSGCVSVDDVLSGCLVELFGGNLEGGSAGLDVTCGDRRTDATDSRTNSRTDRTIVQSASLALAETFLGTGGIWHL